MATQADYDSLRYFKAGEFNVPEKMEAAFLVALDQIRHECGFPFKISSSYREAANSTHGLGVAVDIAMEEKGTCRNRSKLVSTARANGITRIGIYDRHVHLDIGDRIDPIRYAPDCLWWGRST